MTDLVGSSRDVTVLGLGAMGSALAAALLAANREVTVWNRSAGRAAGLVARGASEATTVADAVAAGGPVVVCLYDYASVVETLSPVAGALRDRTVINLTTTTPDGARALAQWAQEHEIVYLDGAIMATPAMLGGAAAQSFYSGSRRAFEENRALLDVWAASTYDGTDAGMASVFDLAMLAGMYTMFAGFLQGAAMVHAAGRSAAELAERAAPFLAGTTEMLATTADVVDDAAFAEPAQSADWTIVGLDTIARASRESGVEPVPIDMVRALVQHQIDAGHGSEGFERLVETMRTSTGAAA